MAWGIFKKIKKAFQDAGKWVHNKVIKPVVNTVKKVVTPDNVKKAIDLGTKIAPLIGAGVSTAAGGNPMAGLKAGHIAQGIGNNLGFGL